MSKLWGYFIAAAPDTATLNALTRTYVVGERDVRPVLEAILMHPALYDGPRLVKSPAVYTAGLLRRLGAPIKTTAWSWLGLTCAVANHASLGMVATLHVKR